MSYETRRMVREARDNRKPLEYCGDKPSYSKKEANTAKNHRYRQDHIRLRIYNCPNCNKWHLTSKI